MEIDHSRQAVKPQTTWQSALSDAQSGLWYAQRLDPANPIYNTGQYVEIDGPLNVAAFREAVNQAMAESPALAVRVAESEGILQTAESPAELAVEDLSGEQDAFSIAQERIARDMSTPLDPMLGGLTAQRVYVLGPDRFIWYQRIHHLVIDGYGTSLLTKRICDLYSARVENRAPLTSGFGSYDAVLAEERAYRDSAKWQSDRDYWMTEFADRPEVAGIGRGIPTTSRTFHRVACALTESFAQGLRERCDTSGISWPDVMVALVGAFIHRHAGGAEAIVGVPTMNRMGSVSARVPSMVMNVLPVRVAIDEAAPLHDWLIGVGRKLRDARRRGKYRSEQLRRDLGLLGGTRRLHGPLINVLPFDESPALAGCRTRIVVLGTGAVDDLTFTLRADHLGEHPHLEIDSNPSIYTEDDASELASRLSVFLDNAVRANRLADVPTLTPQEHQHWIYDVNATGHPVEDTTLVTLIERKMCAQPDAPALAFGGTTLSYAELDAATLALARRLHNRGVRRGDVVAVAAPRSLELVIALVATLRVGAAYLPLDADHPKNRIEAMLGAAKPRVLLTFRALAGNLPASVPVLLLDEPVAAGPDVPFDPPQPLDAAYVIFTSGSTGTPKGVVNEHRGIVNRLEWMRTHYGIGPGDRILQKTPATFDVSVWEFFLPFLSGATLVIAPPDAHKDPAWLASIVREERITTMHFVPSMLAAFLAEPSAKGIEMHRVFCSGEELPSALRDRFHRVIRAELHNLYGPTEAAVDVTWWPASANDKSVPVPIGFPVWNTSMYVLDTHMRPVSPGVAADLYIGGMQVARGYLGRPDLTEERFIADPFHAPNGRMYRTGDVAYWRSDGSLVFLGRSDHQVKIRGLRIELGEIETAILDSGRVARVVVVAREDRPGDQRLVAYVTTADRDMDVAELRSHVGSRLPDYMVPSAFVILDGMPLSRNGKIDRAALPKPELGELPVGRPPETSSEVQLAALFGDVLGVDKVSAEDDFFALGGHSLLAARLMARVRERWSGEPGLGILFSNPTVARLAAYLDKLKADSAPKETWLDSVIPLISSGAGRAALFCIHPAGGISWCYSEIARLLRPARDVYGVQARGLSIPEPMPHSLDAMAGDYVEQIRKIQSQGPYHLAGWSVGGLIAHTMAVQLESLGETTGVVALLDAYPSDVWRDQPEPDEAAALKALLHIAGFDPEAVQIPMTRPSVVEFLRRSGHPLGELSSGTLTAVLHIVENNNALVRRHYHQKFSGTVIHFRAALDHAGKNLAPSQWLPYVGNIVVHDVPSLHAHMTGPVASRYVADLLSNRL